jgi:GNAT superfamily N-acetyltransferase
MCAFVAVPVRVQRLGKEDRVRLDAMYETFEPKDAAFSLPPSHPVRRRAWLDHLEKGINLAAWAEDQIVGHMVLMPDDNAPRAEMAVFVHQDFRRQGIAAELFRKACQEARETNLAALWVIVASDNYPCLAAMRSFGFHTVSQHSGETEMVLHLHLYP